MSTTKGQPKADCLAQTPGIELRVLVPDRWRAGDEWSRAEAPLVNSFQLQVSRINCAWMGPAQNYLHWYPQLAAILQEFRPDIIDIWEEPWSLLSAHTCLLRNALLPSAKIISETEQNLNKHLPFPFERFRSYTLENADFMIGRSQEAVNVLRAKGYAGPCAVVPNGVDTNLFRARDRDMCRRKLGLAGFVAGYVGRLVEEKGLMDMVDALPHCPDGTTLLFVGDGPFKAELMQRAEQIGRATQLKFLPGRSLDELPEVMSALDTLVLASRTTKSWKEQFGRVIIEAQGCQIPVVGSQSGAIPTVIGEGGVVVPERNPAALGAALTELAQDPARCARLGRIGRRQAVDNYSWQCVAEKMAGIYGHVNRHAGRPAVRALVQHS